MKQTLIAISIASVLAACGGNGPDAQTNVTVSVTAGSNSTSASDAGSQSASSAESTSGSTSTSTSGASSESNSNSNSNSNSSESSSSSSAGNCGNGQGNGQGNGCKPTEVAQLTPALPAVIVPSQVLPEQQAPAYVGGYDKHTTDGYEGSEDRGHVSHAGAIPIPQPMRYPSLAPEVQPPADNSQVVPVVVPKATGSHEVPLITPPSDNSQVVPIVTPAADSSQVVPTPKSVATIIAEMAADPSLNPTAHTNMLRLAKGAENLEALRAALVPGDRDGYVKAVRFGCQYESMRVTTQWHMTVGQHATISEQQDEGARFRIAYQACNTAGDSMTDAELQAAVREELKLPVEQMLIDAAPAIQKEADMPFDVQKPAAMTRILANFRKVEAERKVWMGFDDVKFARLNRLYATLSGQLQAWNTSNSLEEVRAKIDVINANFRGQ